MKLAKQEFCFTTEDGVERLTWGEYHARPDLMAKFGLQAVPPKGRETLFFGRDCFSFGLGYLDTHKSKRVMFDDLKRLYEENPLKYFVPQSQVAIDFLNWRVENPVNTFKVLHAGIGLGKSVLGVMDWMLDIIPCEPDWAMFGFGVKWRKFRGPLRDSGIGIVSYQLKNHENTLWPQVIKRWCPREYIRDYVSGKKRISFRTNPHVTINDTTIYFLVSNQDDTAFVSQAMGIYHWDEQNEEAKFNHANGRVRRRHGRHIQTMSPSVLDNKEWTGSGNFLNRVRKGELDLGVDTKFFQMDMDSVSDWVVAAATKKNMKFEWEESPMLTGNKRKLSEGRAILYGEFHERSGLVMEDFDPAMHCVRRFEVPKWWTFYRYHDHGRIEPNAALLIAVAPPRDGQSDIFVIAEHYEKNKEIPENAKEIVEKMSGNEINADGMEIITSHNVIRTISDPRSFSKSLDVSESGYGQTIGDVYARFGLHMLPGSGKYPKDLVPILGEFFMIDPNRAHFETKRKGAPGIYIFDDLRWTKWELENWKRKSTRVLKGNTIVNQDEVVARDDHLMTCLMLMAADRPLFIECNSLDKEETYDIVDEKLEVESSIVGW